MRFAVTWRLIGLPAYAGSTVRIGCAAPLIGMPSSSHWYSSVGLGDHRPVMAVSLWPTAGVPRNPGREAVRNCTASTADALEMTDCPLVVSLTCSCLPASSGAGVYEEAVAPPIAAPSSSHW